MYVSHLSLTDFRSYHQVDLTFEPGITAFVGPNGQGKTNLVEAIGYVSTFSSHRVPSDAPLVRAGASAAVVRSRIVRAQDDGSERALVLDIQLGSGRHNRVKLNGAPSRSRDVIGALRSVLFAPEDLSLVKGDPDGRRRFVDALCVQITPRLAGVFSEYDRVVRQRTALLKSAAGFRGSRSNLDLSTLDIWDAKLAELAARVIVARHAVVAALTPYVAESYREVSDGQGAAELTYRSSMDATDPDELAPDAGPRSFETVQADMLRALERVRRKELERGLCLVGPHRDDLVLTLGGLPAKGYASHGESWSFALALRLASYQLLTHGPVEGTINGEADLWVADSGPDGEPVLMLDDVFAELDAKRRQRLASMVAGARQVFVTAAVPGDVPEQLAGARFDVMSAEVTRVR
ncbi:DNA replication/repair protein RecF [Cellulomonas denverensis]|uniref:DNA replication and repair protein RecF n=1 Tax=Cellulomonas denverensis TaxID=264297 RepID=A0A7X6KYC6_9CELL|nr:DNA replication/repair protein RecF [Cellulomonas denverensis]NKY24290.1 DNA replication/repair protein RecF [Cellulomonas denverensis]GIG26770.1 DNA replication and repair protein RecF [Cellulomonas denverensis]